ncbi:outer membrane protein assembly factor BamB [Arthrobacter sp. UYP6]|uniref:outer membrane protein assembly factor BamB family protein n=1 Tax=Arthrobacter sp. UYP6 TaxID=1756378 RepID=UPI0033973F42
MWKGGLPEVLATTTECPQITVQDGVLVYLADGLLTALDTDTGKQVWQVDCDVEAMIDVVIAVSENAVGVMHTNTFDAFDLDDGTRIADRSADTWFLGLAAGPEGFYLAGSREVSGSPRSVAADLHRISGTTGDTETIGGTAATDDPDLGIFQMAVQDGTILIKSDFEIQALDEATGEMRWLATVRDEPYNSEEEPDRPFMELHASFDGDTVYAYATGEDADEETQNRLLALDTGTGEILASYDLDAGDSSTGPRLDGDNLVFLLNSHTDPEHEALVLPKIR